jgi:6-phosphogluconolactonase
MRQIKRLDTPDSVAEAAAELFQTAAERAIEARGVFSVALSGGSTPRGLYSRLASQPYGLALPWDDIHIFWVDERSVPPEHPESNYRLAFQYLLARMPVPLENIHRIKAELGTQAAANDYEDVVRGFFHLPAEASEGGELGTFDLVYLGMGEDGHTASLFPGTPALQEKKRWVAANHVERLDSWRITLTAPAINQARQVVFLVTGDTKRMRVREVLQGPNQPDELPAQLIQPAIGELIWLVDDQAGSFLSIK